MEQAEEGFRPRIQEYERQLQGLFGNSIEDDESDLMTIDQREALRELDDSQFAGPPAPPPLVPPGDAAVVSGGGDVGGSNMVDVEVKTAATVAKVVEMSTVKRKRGRPPRIQGQAGPTPPPAKRITTTEDEEDVCFICFDGGSLVLCDRRGCPKAYHPSCIKRDEAFFRSKAKWNCGWHICSSCQKASHYMCYTCTYSLCKRCTKDADYVCVRENKGLCGTCLRTIMLIENITPGSTATVQVDFDDKTSWEYLFKIYWIFLKDKLSLTVDELTKAKNPWKGDELPKAKRSWKAFGSTVGAKEAVHSGVGYHGNGGQRSCVDNCYGNVGANHFNRRITNDQPQVLHEHCSLVKEKPVVDIVTPLPEGTVWATKELLEFVSYMKNGDTSMISQFDVQGLLLEYIKRNNLRDPCQKSQIICDSRLMNLFRRSCVGHVEMLRLLEYHFLINEQSPPNDSVKVGVAAAVGSQVGAAGSNDKPHKLIDERGVQINLNSTEYAAIDVHNINLLYLKRSAMENLLEDADKFHEKVVGSFVRVMIPGGDQKQDMYRLVQVVGTTKVAESYRIGSRTTNVMLEILNLDKTEVVTIDGISNQEFSEDECRHLCQSIKYGFFKRLKVAEIQEKASALQPVKVSESLEAEISRLNPLCDQDREKGDRKEHRECVEKLDLLKLPMERQRRLLDFPTVHMDPNMDPSYGSDEAVGESTEIKQGDHMKPGITGSGRKDLELNAPLKGGDINDVGMKEQGTPLADSHCTKVHERMSESELHQGVGEFGLNNENLLKNQLKPTSIRNCDWNGQSRQSHSHAGVASAVIPSLNSSGIELSHNDFETERLWHCQDPYGNVHGPFTLMQLRTWSISGSFAPEVRVWRKDKKQDDSILLVDALAGRFPKDLLQLCNSHSFPQEAAAASNRADNKLGHGFNRSTDATAAECKKYDNDLNVVHNNGTVNVNTDDANELVRSNSITAHTIPWTKTLDVKIANDIQAQSSSQAWKLSEGGKLYENSLSQPREENRNEKWSSHSSMADGNSQKTKKGQTNVRGSDEKRANAEGHISQSSAQNWKPQPIDSSSSRWDSNPDFLSMAKSSAKSEHDQKILVSDLPNPTAKQNHGESKVEAEIKLSVSCNAPGQVSGPNWSTASSLVVGQLPDVAGKWGAYSAPAKPSVVEWDPNLVSASSLNPTEWTSDHVATSTSGTQKLINISPSHRAIDTSSWQPLVPNEFCSLADESVSDLLAEVEAMESLGGMPSPTSKMSCGGELTLGSDNDCFSPVEPFSPALDTGKSDALSSSGDVQMPSQLTAASVLLRLSLMPSQPTTADESLAVSRRPSQLNVTDATDKHHQLSRVPPPSVVPDEPLQASQMPSRSTLSVEPLRLWQTGALDSQKSFSGHSSSSAEVEGGKKPSDVSVNQWNTRSEVPLASSTVDPGGAASNIQTSSSSTVSQVEAGSDNQHPASSRTDPKWGRVKESTNLNHGAVSQGNADMVWVSGHGSIQQQASKTAAISTGNMGYSGQRDIMASHTRYAGEHRYSGQREHHRNHSQNRDSGFSRDRSSWNSRQPTHGSGGGGSYKPSGKGQRVCKFYENGYCKKGASCTYFHP